MRAFPKHLPTHRHTLEAPIIKLQLITIKEGCRSCEEVGKGSRKGIQDNRKTQSNAIQANPTAREMEKALSTHTRQYKIRPS